MQTAVRQFPPRFGSGSVRTSPTRFSVGSTIDGHEVVDFDGRSIVPAFSEGEAREIVVMLNDAAAGGTTALSRAIQSL